MTNERAFVLDTGAIISALLLPRSVLRQAFDYVFTCGRVLASTATIDELDDVLHRPKFDRYVSQEARLVFLAAYIRDIVIVDVRETITDCRDPKDNKFLELAISGSATYIISSDNHLLELHPYRGVSVVTPRDVLTYFS